jgi:hypothetical protein
MVYQHCWQRKGLSAVLEFIMSGPGLQPIEKLTIKITTKAHLYSSASIEASHLLCIRLLFSDYLVSFVVM